MKYCLELVFSKDAAESVVNYRPISLLCITSEIKIEYSISQKTFQHLRVQCNPSSCLIQLSKKSHSTCSSLLTLNCLDSYYCLVIRYNNFNIPFDTVSHKKVFARLRFYGIRGSILLSVAILEKLS